MTTALCIRCGSFKFGSMNPCGACHFKPASIDDLTRSLVLSDHHFTKDQLNRMSARVAAGTGIDIDLALYNNVRSGLMQVMQNERDSKVSDNKRGFFSSIFRRSDTSPVPQPSSTVQESSTNKVIDRSDIKWTMVPENIHVGKFLLIGAEQEVEVTGTSFAMMLVMAKINGWRGVAQFFDIVDGQGFIRKIKDGARIDADEAIELGVKYYDFVKENAKGGNRGDMDEKILRLCSAGGFYIEIK